MSDKLITEGHSLRLPGVFKVSNVATDPTTVTFKIKSPSGTVTTYIYATDAQLVKDSTGNYHVDWLFNESGDWWYEWIGSGITAPGRNKFRVIVEDSPIVD